MEEYIYREMARTEEEHWWFIARRRIVETVISSLDLPAEARILDAGCGTGGNLTMLSQFGAVTGVELRSN